ncbi:serine/threonine protein kinase, partial [Saccharothrix hoggarensis]
MRVVELAESLLAWLHGWSGVSVCPGDWAWTATAFGALIGVLPTVAALLSITVRRVVGNSYGPVTGAIFAVLGVMSTLVLPWMAFSATVKLLRTRALPGMESLSESPCVAFTQYEYLVGAPSVVEAITANADVMDLIAACATAVLALMCLLFVMLQAGSAFRLGPNWPRRLFWPPFLVLLLSTSALPVTLVGHLLLGFFPIALVGSLVVRVFGLTTAMLNRPGRDRGNPSPQPAVSRTPPPQPQQPQGPNPKPPPYQVEKPPPYQPAQIPPYQPVPPYRPTPPQRHYPPTRVAESAPVAEPQPARAEPPKPPPYQVEKPPPYQPAQ